MRFLRRDDGLRATGTWSLARRWLVASAFAATTLTARAEPRQQACTVTLAGAVTATLACVPSVSWSRPTGTAVVAIVVPRPAPLASVNAALERPGEPTAGTWKGTDEGAVAGLVVQSRGEPGRAWTASAGGREARIGSYTLTLASVAAGRAGADGKGYDAHGELTATLLPQRGTRAGGTVTLKARF